MNFDRACKGPSHANDVRSFGDLLQEMAQRCNDDNQQVGLLSAMCIICKLSAKNFPLALSFLSTTTALLSKFYQVAKG